MRVLALDTALDQTAVAVFDAARGAVLAAKCEPMQRGHADALFPMIEAVMAAAGIGFDGIDRIGVTVGPGSFTGVRIGLAAAKASPEPSRAPLLV